MKTLLNATYRFFTKNWMEVLFVLLAVAALVMYFINPNLNTEHHIVFWISVILSALAAILSDTEKWDIGAYSTIYFLIIAIMWLLPISIYWTLIPLLIIGIINLLSIDDSSSKMLPGVLIITAIAAFLFAVMHEVRVRDAYIASQTPQTVVIKHVDKQDKGNILIYTENYVTEEGKQHCGILRFYNIDDDWKLNDGDTIRIIIYEGKITYMER